MSFLYFGSNPLSFTFFLLLPISPSLLFLPFLQIPFSISLPFFLSPFPSTRLPSSYHFLSHFSPSPFPFTFLPFSSIIAPSLLFISFYHLIFSFFYLATLNHSFKYFFCFLIYLSILNLLSQKTSLLSDVSVFVFYF